MAAAALGQRVRSYGVFVSRQRHLDRSIAGGVSQDLPAACIELANDPIELVGIDRWDTSFSVVEIRLKHCCRVGVDRSIERQTDRARLEQRIIGVLLRDGVELKDR